MILHILSTLEICAIPQHIKLYGPNIYDIVSICIIQIIKQHGKCPQHFSKGDVTLFLGDKIFGQRPLSFRLWCGQWGDDDGC